MRVTVFADIGGKCVVLLVSRVKKLPYMGVAFLSGQPNSMSVEAAFQGKRGKWQMFIVKSRGVRCIVLYKHRLILHLSTRRQRTAQQALPIQPLWKWTAHICVARCHKSLLVRAFCAVQFLPIRADVCGDLNARHTRRNQSGKASVEGNCVKTLISMSPR